MTFQDFTPPAGEEWLNIDHEEVRRYEYLSGRVVVVKYPIGVMLGSGQHKIVYEWLDDDDTYLANTTVPFDPTRDVLKWISSSQYEDFEGSYAEYGFQEVSEAKRTYEIADGRRVPIRNPISILELEGHHIILYDYSNGEKLAGVSVPYNPEKDVLRTLPL